MGPSKKSYLFTILAFCVILPKTGSDQVVDNKETQRHGDESSEGLGDIKPQGRYYSLSTCEYRMQPGYTCLSCSRALHCYISNTAILVDCRGLFPYCRDGHCSMYKGTACDAVAHNKPLTATTIQGVKYNVTAANTLLSDSPIQMMPTEIDLISPDETIVSQAEVETVPADNAQNLNKPPESLNTDDSSVSSDNFVNTR